jgi:hypothetical protein
MYVKKTYDRIFAELERHLKGERDKVGEQIAKEKDELEKSLPEAHFKLTNAVDLEYVAKAGDDFSTIMKKWG